MFEKKPLPIGVQLTVFDPGFREHRMNLLSQSGP